MTRLFLVSLVVLWAGICLAQDTSPTPRPQHGPRPAPPRAPSTPSPPNPVGNVCPRGCRCTALPRIHRRHRWHHRLALYRMREAAGSRRGGWRLADPAFPVTQHGDPDAGKEVTCLGLGNLPDQVPEGVTKMTFYGDANTPRYFMRESAGRGPNSGRQGDSEHAALGSRDLMSFYYPQLTSIPRTRIRKYWSLRQLVIENNRIKVIHALEFAALVHLKRLRLRNNRMRALKNHAFKGLDNLKELDLSKNHIKKIRKTLFFDVPNLKALNLHKNRIEGLHKKTFKHLRYLEDLDLSDNYLKQLNSRIFEPLLQLKVLRLDYNHLQELRMRWFATFGSLETLSVKGNRLVSLDPGILSPLSNLKELDISINELDVIQAGAFRGLDSLQTLNAKKNNITVIQDNAFINLQSLSSLDVAENSVAELTNHTFSGLDKLKLLKLAHNELLELPHSAIGHMRHLERLDASHNHLKKVFEHNFFDLLELKELRLDHNSIRALEKKALMVSLMSSYSKLTWVYLNHNHIVTLSRDNLYGLPYVKFLNLAHNQINALDDDTFSMVGRLHSLILSENEIFRLGAASFKHLRYLSQIDLSSNRLRSIDSGTFQRLKHVEEINLNHNYIERLSYDVFDDTPSLYALNMKGNMMHRFDLNKLLKLRGLRYLDLAKNNLLRVDIDTDRQHNLYFLSLADNELKQLNSSIGRVLTPTGSMHLYGNPWKCDCELSWLRTLVAQPQTVVADYSDIVCKSPAQFEGEQILSLEPSEFRCRTPPGGYRPRGHLASDGPLQADKPPVARGRDLSCDFLPHVTNSSRADLKSSKEDVHHWTVGLFNVNGSKLCFGVHVSRDSILTHAQCWAEYDSRSRDPIKVKFEGDTDTVTVGIRSVKPYSGDGVRGMTLVRITTPRELRGRRQFPCVLSQNGLQNVRKNRKHVLLSVHIPVVTSSEAVHIPVMTSPEAVHTFRTVELTLRAEKELRAGGNLVVTSPPETVLKRLNGQREGMAIKDAFFVKVGRTRWALAGLYGRPLFTEQTNAKKGQITHITLG